MEKSAKSKKIEMPSLSEVRAMPRGDAAKTLKSLTGKHSMNVDRVLNSVYALPLISMENLELSQQVEKTTGTTTGKLSLKLSISHKDQRLHKKHHSGPMMSLSLVLGTPQHRALLAHHTIGVGRSGTVQKSVELAFDWNTANADGGESGGAVILRLLLEEVRGLDSEIAVPLR